MTAVLPDVEIHRDRAAWAPTGRPASISSAATLGAALVDWADERPHDPAYYVYDSTGACAELSVGALRDRAADAAAAFAAHGVQRGDRVGISLDTSPELLAALFGTALLGAVPFILEPPFAEGRARIWAERVRTAVDRTRPRLLVVSAALRQYSGLTDRDIPLLEPPFPTGAAAPDPPTDPGDVAFLQFTSGTLGHAKAAVITHRALFANAAASAAATPYRADDLMVSWLPLHHDMGLVGATLSTFLHRIPVVLMSPMAFALRPERWLWAVHRFRATLSPGPNFAYQMCATRVPDTALRGLDLRSWRVAYNGAELVNVDTVALWQRRFGRYGMRPETMRPCYGMAEMGVAAAFSAAGTVPRVERIDRELFARTGRAVVVSADHPAARPFVSVGQAPPGYQLVVVDDDGEAVPERTQGNITVRGPSLMAGYYQDPAATAHAVRDGWLHTGDLGFVADGELFVTGRVKDLIVIAGRNYHPYPAEAAAVAAVPGARRGAAAAVGVPDPARGSEALAIVVESAAVARPERVASLSEAVARAVTDELGVRPCRVVVVRPGTLARTPSGKLQRQRVAADLVAGRLDGADPRHSRADPAGP